MKIEEIKQKFRKAPLLHLSEGLKDSDMFVKKQEAEDFFVEEIIYLLTSALTEMEGNRREKCTHFGHTDGESIDCDKNTYFNDDIDSCTQIINNLMKK